MAESFEVSMAGDEKYYVPDPSYKEQAWTKDYARTYTEFLADKEGFWEKQAHQLEWFKKWDKVLEWNYPYARWFVDGKTNITYNCLDRRVRTTAGTKWHSYGGAKKETKGSIPTRSSSMKSAVWPTA